MMSAQREELIDWCRREREEALRQLELFGDKGIKALLQMPDGSTQEITSGVIKHQSDNLPFFERLISSLSS